jgi:hypothetical protein
MDRFPATCTLALLLCLRPLAAQVIEFETNGLKYQTLTRSSVTIMYAQMPSHIHEYTIIQAAISNGSLGPYVIRPEDFSYERAEGPTIRAVAAQTVISMLMQKGSGNDVIKLVMAYEGGVYGNPHMRSTNGYEQRRQAALAMGGATRFRAAATASAIALVQNRLARGDSTDGAVFFPNDGKPLSGGHVVVRTNTDTFTFKAE